jgi:hypothetical protein
MIDLAVITSIVARDRVAEQFAGPRVTAPTRVRRARRRRPAEPWSMQLKTQRGA